MLGQNIGFKLGVELGLKLERRALVTELYWSAWFKIGLGKWLGLVVGIQLGRVEART